jgi:WD40 repeat protein
MKDISTMAFSLDGNQLAFGYYDGTIRLWDCQTGTEGPVLNGRSSLVWKLFYSPCYRWIVSVDSGANVRLWDMHDAEAQPLPVGDNADVGKYIYTVVAFSSTGSQFVFTNRDNTIHLYDIPSRESQGRIKFIGINMLAFSPNDQQIAIGTKKGVIYLWDLQSEEPCAKLVGKKDWVQCIAYSPCGQWIASGSDDKTVGIWHRQLSGGVESWSRAHSIHAFSSYVYKVVWSPVVPMEFVTGTLSGTVQVWRMSVDEGEDISVKMVWGSHLTSFCAEGAKFANAKGLDPVSQKILVQYGALCLPEQPESLHP